MRVLVAMACLGLLAATSGCRPVTLEGASPLTGVDGLRPPPTTDEDDGSGIRNATSRVTFSVSCQECEVFATPARSRTDGARIVKGQWTSTVDVDPGLRSQASLTVVPVENRTIRSVRILIDGRLVAERRPTGIQARQDRITLTVPVRGR